VASRYFTNNFKCDRGLRDIAGANRVTIHGRQRRRRLRAQRNNVISEHAPKRFIESNGFGRQRSRISQHALQCVRDRH
jgi:hypothetical protein